MRKKKEKRNHTRVPMMVRIEDLQTGKKEQYYSREVSKGGLFLETSDFYSVGTPLRLSFQIPGSDHQVEVQSTVAHVHKDKDDELSPGMGVRFEGLDPKTKKLIEEYVEKLEDIRKKLSKT